MRKKSFINKRIFFLYIILFIFCGKPPLVNSQILTGDVWFSPSEVISLQNTQCITDLHLNSGEQRFGAYGFDIFFDEDIITVDTNEGNNGVSVGPDGFIAAVNATNPGILSITGFDAEGTGPGTDLNILTIYWLTHDIPGATPLDLVINKIVDEKTAPIGESPRALNGIVTIFEADIGDADMNGFVDIVDALIIAQNYVGLSPHEFHPEVADFDLNGIIDIIDALLIAQYYVGLITTNPTPSPSPTSTNTQSERTPIPDNLPENWADVTAILQVNNNQTNKCIKNGFVVLSNIESNTLSRGYAQVSQAHNVPTFITTDALLHVFHVTFAHMSEVLEKTELYDIMMDLLHYLNTDVMTEYTKISGDNWFVKSAAKKLWIYTAVAEALIKGDTGINGTDIDPIKIEVNTILDDLYSYKIPESGALEDYTQYEPRGHYNGDTELENYFRAITWLERQRFHIEEEIECTASAIMGYVLIHNSAMLKLWDTMYGFFKSLSNDAPCHNPKDIIDVLKDSADYATKGYLLLETLDNRVTFMNTLSSMSDPDALYTLFMDTGFSMDVDTLVNTIGPENVTGRTMPNSLDVGATVFNSMTAYAEHQAEMDVWVGEYSLQAKIDNLIIKYNRKSEIEWTQSIYNYMLYSLRSLSDIPVGNVPVFMRNEYWEREKLNTQLAAWTELHNDNIVYQEPTPTPIPTPIPTPDPTATLDPTPGQTPPPFDSNVIVQYKCGEPSINSTQIKPRINIINNSDQSIPLSELTLRYFYTKEGVVPEVFTIDFAVIGESKIWGDFHSGYVEIGFASNAGILDPNNETGEMQIRINKTDWSPYDQSNDISFNGSITTYTDWIYISLYYDGVLIWGDDPFFTPAPTSEPTPETEPTPSVSTIPPTETPTPIPTLTPTPTPIPQGFIEPYPDFYDRLKTMCDNTVTAITDAGFGTIHIDKFTEISQWAERLKNCAHIILEDTTPFSAEDILFIKNWGNEVDDFFMDSGFIPESDAKSHVITDIFNHEGLVLHEAVGKLHPIIIFFQEPATDTLLAGVGYTLSYYEFEESNYNRINDEEWELILNTNPPDVPIWTEGFIEN